MDVYAQIAVKIIKSQEAIIGPVAAEQAGRVPYLKVDWDKQQISIEGNEAKAIDALVEVYKELFGQISVEVSKEAAASLVGQLPAGQLPEALK
jgi:hypothetical protein